MAKGRKKSGSAPSAEPTRRSARIAGRAGTSDSTDRPTATTSTTAASDPSTTPAPPPPALSTGTTSTAAASGPSTTPAPPPPPPALPTATTSTAAVSDTSATLPPPPALPTVPATAAPVSPLRRSAAAKMYLNSSPSAVETPKTPQWKRTAKDKKEVAKQQEEKGENRLNEKVKKREEVVKSKAEALRDEAEKKREQEIIREVDEMLGDYVEDEDSEEGDDELIDEGERALRELEEREAAADPDYESDEDDSDFDDDDDDDDDDNNDDDAESATEARKPDLTTPDLTTPDPTTPNAKSGKAGTESNAESATESRKPRKRSKATKPDSSKTHAKASKAKKVPDRYNPNAYDRLDMGEREPSLRPLSKEEKDGLLTQWEKSVKHAITCRKATAEGPEDDSAEFPMSVRMRKFYRDKSVEEIFAIVQEAVPEHLRTILARDQVDLQMFRDLPCVTEEQLRHWAVYLAVIVDENDKILHDYSGKGTAFFRGGGVGTRSWSYNTALRRVAAGGSLTDNEAKHAFLAAAADAVKKGGRVLWRPVAFFNKFSTEQIDVLFVEGLFTDLFQTLTPGYTTQLFHRTTGEVLCRHTKAMEELSIAAGPEVRRQKLYSGLNHIHQIREMVRGTSIKTRIVTGIYKLRCPLCPTHKHAYNPRQWAPPTYLGRPFGSLDPDSYTCTGCYAWFRTHLDLLDSPGVDIVEERVNAVQSSRLATSDTCQVCEEKPKRKIWCSKVKGQQLRTEDLGVLTHFCQKCNLWLVRQRDEYRSDDALVKGRRVALAKAKLAEAERKLRKLSRPDSCPICRLPDKSGSRYTTPFVNGERLAQVDFCCMGCISYVRSRLRSGKPISQLVQDRINSVGKPKPPKPGQCICTTPQAQVSKWLRTEMLDLRDATIDIGDWCCQRCFKCLDKGLQEGRPADELIKDQMPGDTPEPENRYPDKCFCGRPKAEVKRWAPTLISGERITSPTMELGNYWCGACDTRVRAGLKKGEPLEETLQECIRRWVQRSPPKPEACFCGMPKEDVTAWHRVTKDTTGSGVDLGYWCCTACDHRILNHPEESAQQIRDVRRETEARRQAKNRGEGEGEDDEEGEEGEEGEGAAGDGNDVL